MNIPIYGKDEKTPITAFENWYELSPPARAYHWAEGRSAMEMARLCFKDGLKNSIVPKDIHRIIKNTPGFGNLQFKCAYGEKKTYFKDTPRGPRNHDLLIVSELEGEIVIIGVEGKERESFGDTIKNRLSKAKVNSKFPERINRFCQGIFGTNQNEEHLKLRYQLFSGIAGTLVEAEKADAAAAIFIVHQIISERTPLPDIKRNENDFNDFVKLLFQLDDMDVSDSLMGPLEVPWDKSKPKIKLYIGKVISRI